MSVILQDFVAIGQTIPEIWQFFDFFFTMAAVRHLAFVISILTTHDEYLAVFTTVQNFV